MSSTKEKTISGLIWSFTERFASQAVTFVVGIVLARLLSPKEFGLIGMLTIFIGLSTVFVQSGFNQALIRKTNCTKKDYVTVFYFNLLVSLVFYAILFVTSGLISDFYGQPKLQNLIKVLGLVLVINALTIVQRTKITKRVDFKLLTKVSVIASIGSGALGITMAATGFGVWSLVFRQVAQGAFLAGSLWFWNRWQPQGNFSKKSFKELFKFGNNIMLNGVISIIYKNIYNVIIGIFYPAANLGYYTRADQFKNLPSETIGQVIERVSFPILSSLKYDKKQFHIIFDRLLRSTMLITFTLLIGLASISKELVVVLMGEQWLKAGEYLQILCFSAIFYPLDKQLNSILKIVGRSDSVLKYGLLDKFLTIPLIFITIFFGIKISLYFMIIHRFVYVLMLANKVKIYINFNIKILLKLILPSFCVLIIMYVTLMLVDEYFNFHILILLTIKIIAGAIIVIGLFEATKFKDYIYLKNKGKEEIKTFLKRT